MARSSTAPRDILDFPAPTSTGEFVVALPLPAPITSFVDRPAALETATAFLRDGRLLTLSGAGGSGKTRLAIELARRATGCFREGVTWVDLALIESPDLVVQQVAAAVGIRDEGGGAAITALVGLLRRQHRLVVLDNCEHLVDEVARLAERLVRECPELSVLATSREPLGITGERAWLVPPMSLPAKDASVEAALGSEAVRLFVERARDVHPTFAVTPENVTHVVEICRRLDGIPLAIELAAARVRALGPADIAARLDDAFRLLGSGSRTALPRHRTLRAMMEWSVRLLSPPKQALLRRLGVFAGGFTLEAVEAICIGGDVDEVEVLDLLAQLVERSLVVAVEDGTRVRYRLLETVRQYAMEQLVAAGEATALRDAHAAWYETLVHDVVPHLVTETRVEQKPRLDADFDNVRAAIAWYRERDPVRHLALVGTLCFYWFSSRNWTEGRRRLAEALALPVAHAPWRARADALFAVGVLATLQGEADVAIPALGEARALRLAHDDGRGVAFADVYLGMALGSRGDPAAMRHAQDAERWFRAHDDLYGLRLALLIMSTAAMVAGDHARAVALAEEGVAIARRYRLDREIAISLQSLAAAHIAAGDPRAAPALVRESLVRMQRDPSFLFIPRGMEFAALLAWLAGRHAEGVRLYAAADAGREAIGAAQFAIDIARYAAPLEGARTALGPCAFDAAWHEGRALQFEVAILETIALCDVLAKSGAAPAVITGDDDADPRGMTATGTSNAADGDGALVPAPGAGLHVRVLGPLEIHVDGERLASAAWRSARPRELFLHLLLHPQGRTREQIGTVFWPDLTPAQLKNNFHVTLHHVRKALGRGDAIVIDGDRYRIDPALPVWCDALVVAQEGRELLRRARAGDDVTDALTAVVALHRGPVADGLPTGDWLLEHHDHLVRLVADGRWWLARTAMERSDWLAAIEQLEALLRIDEFREEAHRALMTAYASSGDRARALAHFWSFAATLERELDAEPEADTVALHQSIAGRGA